MAPNCSHHFSVLYEPFVTITNCILLFCCLNHSNTLSRSLAYIGSPSSPQNVSLRTSDKSLPLKLSWNHCNVRSLLTKPSGTSCLEHLGHFSVHLEHNSMCQCSKGQLWVFSNIIASCPPRTCPHTPWGSEIHGTRPPCFPA